MKLPELPPFDHKPFSPPMCVNEADADFLLEVLDRALGSL